MPATAKKRPAKIAKSKKPVKQQKVASSVRVAKFKIGNVTGGKETLAEWRELAEHCTEIINTIFKQWVIWHEERDSWKAVNDWYLAVKKWYKQQDEAKAKLPPKERKKYKPKTAKPTCKVLAVTPEFTKHIRAILGRRFTGVHSRVKELLIQQTCKKIVKTKSANGSLPGWMSIILSRQALSNVTGLSGIPFDIGNAPIDTWNEKDGEWTAYLRVNRVDDGSSRVDEFKLVTATRRAYGQLVLLRRVMSGEYKFCGSFLKYSKSDRQWYVFICFQRPKLKKTKPIKGLVARLVPQTDHPWLLILPDREIWIGGTGKYLEAVRRNLYSQRQSRKANYRYAGSANKGHGRNRALEPHNRFSQGWKHVVHRTNHEVTKKVVEICQENRVETLYYEQPTGELREKLFLTITGREKGDSTGWDWFAVGSMLQYKADDVGLKVKVNKVEDDGESD